MKEFWERASEVTSQLTTYPLLNARVGDQIPASLVQVVPKVPKAKSHFDSGHDFSFQNVMILTLTTVTVGLASPWLDLEQRLFKHSYDTLIF